MDKVVVFDGMCNLCAGSVRFILEHESAPRLLFTPLQSKAGARLLREFGFDPAEARTFVLIAQGTAYVKSDAAIRIASHLRGPWKLLAYLKIVPRPVRDWAYDFIGRHRYRWFGRRKACMAAPPEAKGRFIEQ